MKISSKVLGLAMLAGALGDGFDNERASAVAKTSVRYIPKTQLTKKQSKARKKAKASRKSRKRGK